MIGSVYRLNAGIGLETPPRWGAGASARWNLWAELPLKVVVRVLLCPRGSVWPGGGLEGPLCCSGRSVRTLVSLWHAGPPLSSARDEPWATAPELWEGPGRVCCSVRTPPSSCGPCPVAASHACRQLGLRPPRVPGLVNCSRCRNSGGASACPGHLSEECLRSDAL